MTDRERCAAARDCEKVSWSKSVIACRSVRDSQQNKCASPRSLPSRFCGSDFSRQPKWNSLILESPLLNKSDRRCISKRNGAISIYPPCSRYPSCWILEDAILLQNQGARTAQSYILLCRAFSYTILHNVLEIIALRVLGHWKTAKSHAGSESGSRLRSMRRALVSKGTPRKRQSDRKSGRARSHAP